MPEAKAVFPSGWYTVLLLPSTMLWQSDTSLLHVMTLGMLHRCWEVWFIMPIRQNMWCRGPPQRMIFLCLISLTDLQHILQLHLRWTIGTKSFPLARFSVGKQQQVCGCCKKTHPVVHDNLSSAPCLSAKNHFKSHGALLCTDLELH